MSGHTFRSRASFGKRLEFVVIAELLHRGFDVYVPLVDDQGIDAIIRQERNGLIRFLEVQIKARSRDCDPKNAGTFAAMHIEHAHSRYFFIFYSEQTEACWVVPSTEVVRLASRNQSGKNAGKYSIHFCKAQPDGSAVTRPEFDDYRNRYDLLEWS